MHLKSAPHCCAGALACPICGGSCRGGPLSRGARYTESRVGNNVSYVAASRVAAAAFFLRGQARVRRNPISGRQCGDQLEKLRLGGGGGIIGV